MDEAQVLAFDHLAIGLMVGDHQRDVDVQIARLPAPEQVVQAVALFAHAQHHLHPFFALAQRPLGVQLGRHRRKRLAQRGQVEGQGAAVHRQAREKPAVAVVGELIDFQQVAAVEGDEGGQAREQAGAVGAGDFEEGGHMRSVPRKEKPPEVSLRRLLFDSMAPQCTPCSAKKRSASSADLQPMPAAVTAWRYTWSATSPATKQPSISVVER